MNNLHKRFIVLTTITAVVLSIFGGLVPAKSLNAANFDTGWVSVSDSRIRGINLGSSNPGVSKDCGGTPVLVIGTTPASWAGDLFANLNLPAGDYRIDIRALYGHKAGTADQTQETMTVRTGADTVRVADLDSHSFTTCAQERDGIQTYTNITGRTVHFNANGDLTLDGTGQSIDIYAIRVRADAGDTTPTPTPVEPGKFTLSATCYNGNTPKVSLDWTDSVHALKYDVERRVHSSTEVGSDFKIIENGGGLNQTNLVDSSVVANTLYDYRVKARNNTDHTFSNIVEQISTSPSNCGSYTPTVLACYPSYQTVNVNQWANLSATGGSSNYTWEAVGGNPTNGSGTNFNTYYTNVGARGVTVRNGTQVAVCTVNVVSNYTTPTPTPIPYGNNLDIHKLGRNISAGATNFTGTISASRGDTLEFQIKVKSLSNVTLNNVIVRDVLPAGLVYVNNGTSLNGTVVSNGITGNGINIGSLTPGQEATVMVWVIVDTQFNYPIGTTTLTNRGYAKADNVAEVYSTMTINVTRGSITTVTKVPTGPVSSVVLALLISALGTLGYIGYAQTDMYRKHSITGLINSQRRNKDKFNFI